MTRRPLPPPTGPGEYPKLPGMECMGYDVYSHSDDPVPGRTPASAVLLIMRVEMDGNPMGFGLRLKSRAAVEHLIDALERHLVDVWPKPIHRDGT